MRICKKILFSCSMALIIAGALSSASFSHELTIENGLAWLKEQQDQESGAWGGGCIRYTAAVISALAKLQETGSAYNAGLEFLEAATPENIDYVSKRIYALAGSEVLTEDDGQYLAAHQNADGGFGFRYGYPSTVVDSLPAAEALLSTGIQEREIIGALLYYLTAQQSGNGGFSFADGAAESLFLTAYAVAVFNAFLPGYDLSEHIEKAASFLMTFKHPGGGFGEADASAVETALCIRAMGSAGVNLNEIMQGREFVLSQQQPDGSWDGDAYATALCLSALAETVTTHLPNLTINSSTLSISPANPAADMSITISCTVANTGTQAAENISVAFYRGDPSAGGELIDNAAIAVLEPAGSAQARTAWTLTGITGAGDIYVFVDPDNLITESDETDNRASGSFTSGTKADLLITPADISFDNITPLDGVTFTMAAVVRNTGETDSGPVEVACYNGKPGAGGIKIGQIQYGDIAGGSSVTSFFSLTLIAGAYDIYVLADPDGSTNESSTMNNTASATITVRPIEFQGIDLSVSASGIAFEPAYPRQGDRITVIATIRNSGDRDAHSVPVKLYDGDPASGGILIASHVFSTIMTGFEEQLTLAADFQTGSHEIYCAIDPENTVQETSKINNTSHKTLSVLPAQTVIDLALSADDISFDPQTPDGGQEVVMKFGVHNTGTLRLENIKAGIYEGNPDAGGTLLYPEFYLGFIEAGGTGWVTIHRDTTGWAGEHKLYLIADPDNRISEADEGNNRASKTLTVTGKPGADMVLSAAGITLAPSVPVPGDIVTIACSVENRGTQAIPVAELSFYADGVRLGVDVIENLLPGRPASAEIIWDTTGIAGLHTISAVADEANSFAETNEFNNSAEKQIVVAAPDLQILSRDISFTPETLLAGESVQIGCSIYNTGQQDAASFNLAFYSGDTLSGAQSIGTVSIPSVAAGGSQTAALTWQTPAAAGSYKIYVQADPENTIIEAGKANNIARRTLTTATQTDLTVEASKITVSPIDPSITDIITVQAVIENRGGTDSNNVPVGFYDGTPAADDSNRIGESLIVPRLCHGDSEIVAKSFFLTEGAHEIYVVVDPGNLIGESDKTNNSAQVAVDVEAAQDIEVRSQDMDISPAAPAPGDTLIISALVRNRGSRHYAAVTVRFFDGSPEAGGVQIGPDQTLCLAEAQTASVTAGYPAVSGGEHSLYVVADPDNLLTEDDKRNNRAFKQVVISSSEPDLTMHEGQFNSTPLSPRAGEAIRIAAKVTNHGESDAGPVMVQFYDGEPGSASCSLIAQTVIAPGISAGDTAAVNAEAVLTQGVHRLYAVIDPANTIIESNENNNQSTLFLNVQELDGFYDDCGNPGQEPHLAQGSDVVITGAAPGNAAACLSASAHPSSVTYAYGGLNANGYYSVVVNYLQEPNGGRVQSLSADGVMIHDALALPEGLSRYYRYDLPPAVYQDGAVSLSFDLVAGPDALVSEIYLFRKTGKKENAMSGGADWLATHQQVHGGWPPYVASQNNGSSLGALAVAGGERGQIQGRVYELQATNGSWENSIRPTAYCVLGLLDAGEPMESEVIQNAVAWIKTMQLDDGSWAQEPMNTGLAIMALSAAGEDKNSGALQGAKQWLLSTQNTDGFWGVVPGGASDIDRSTYPVIGLILTCTTGNSAEQTAITNAVCYFENHWDASRNRFIFEYMLLLRYRGISSGARLDSLKSQLQSRQNADGGWNQGIGYAAVSSPFITSEAVNALRKAGVTGSSVTRGAQWLSGTMNQFHDLIDQTETGYETAVACGALYTVRDTATDPTVMKAVQRIIERQSGSGTWNNSLPSEGSACWLTPTHYMLWALASANVAVTGRAAAITRAQNAIFHLQKSWGGWVNNDCQNTIPDVKMTTMSLFALLSSGINPEDSRITRGVQWLMTQRLSSGVWDTMESTARSVVILKMKGGYAAEIDTACDWLRQHQNGDGGWGQPYSTVTDTFWAVNALRNANAEDLLTARAVQWLLCYINSDGGWASVPGISSSTTANTALAVWALGMSSYHTDIDLELSFGKQYYYPGDMVRMKVNPLNTDAGIQTIEGTVNEYCGNTAPITFSAFGQAFMGTHVLSAKHLPGTDTVNIIAAGDNGEGTVGGSFIVKNSTGVLPDVSVRQQDITCSPRIPAHGDAVLIQAGITNAQFRDAVSVKVQCYDGYPEAGGILIGQTVIERVCGIDNSSAQFIWQASAGVHEIYVVVDPDETLDESNEQNNRAYATVTVSALSSKPDLVLAYTDLQVLPQSPAAGEPVALKATVHNAGGSDAENIAVRFKDGSIPLGHDLSIPRLAPGASQTVDAVLNSFNTQGRHYIHAVADPENALSESNENNNEAIRTVDVGTPDLPELVVNPAEITFSSQNPAEGETVVIKAAVANAGTPVQGVKVAFYDGEPSKKVLIKAVTVYEIIPGGGSVPLSVPWETAGLTGSRSVYVVADPDNTLTETNKENNTGCASIAIVSSGLSVEVLADKPQYQPGEDAGITTRITNHTAEQRVVTLDITMNDSLGAVVSQQTKNLPACIGSYETIILESVLTIGSSPAGEYMITALVKENEIPRTKHQESFLIIAVMHLSGTVITDRVLYNAHEQVTLTSNIRSFSPNFIFTDLQATITIKDETGAILYADEKQLPPLLPLQSTSWTANWYTNTCPPGVYTADFQITSSGTVLGHDNATFSILQSFDGQKALQGSLALSPSDVHHGQKIIGRYAVKNIGNRALPAVSLIVRALDVQTQNTTVLFADNCSLDIGCSCNGTRILSTDILPVGSRIAVLAGAVEGITQTIAFAPFTVTNQCPVAEGGEDKLVYVGQTATLDAGASHDADNDTITYRWALVEKPLMSLATIMDATAAVCSMTPDRQGDYSIELTVHDGVCQSIPYRVILSTENRPPIADAGPDQEATAGDTVLLSGTESADPDGDALTGYRWLIVSRPEGSITELSDNSSATPKLFTDREGRYRVQLVVSDGKAESSPDMIIITARAVKEKNCDDIPWPVSPCPQKKDYPNEHCCSSVRRIASYEDYLQYVRENYGYDGKAYKSIKIIRNINMQKGDLLLHSPCCIELKKQTRLSAPQGTVCLDGKQGVRGEQDFRIDARNIALLSERGEVRITKSSVLHSDALYIEGSGGVSIESGCHVTAQGSITLVAADEQQSSGISIKNGVCLVCGGLFMRSGKDILMSNLAAIETSGPLRLISSGDAVRIKYTAARADSLCLEGRGEVSIGGLSVLAVTGNLSLLSNGETEKSIAWIKSGTAVTAGSLNIEGYRAAFDPYSFLHIDGAFHMEASDENQCSARGLYRAESVSGNCLE